MCSKWLVLAAKLMYLLIVGTRPLDFGAASSAASRQGKGDVGRSQKKKNKNKNKNKKKKKRNRGRRKNKKKKNKPKRATRCVICVITEKA